LKQPKEKVLPSPDVGLETPRHGRNVRNASLSSTGDASALERVVGEYRKPIVELEIDIGELKVDVETLASDKTEFLLNFSNI
jgi:hypothetical protein